MKGKLLLSVVTGLFLFSATLGFAEGAKEKGAGEPEITLTWLTAAGHNQMFLQLNKEHIEKTVGVKINQVVEPDPRHYELCMEDWMGGGGRFDIVSNHPLWNGDFMRGYYTQLDPYLDQFDAWKHYEDIRDTYRKLYCERGGKVFAVVQDADCALMYYRKDIINNPDYQKKFKKKYGYDIPIPPDTWDQLNDVADFFTGWDWDEDGEVEYGLGYHPWRRDDMELAFLPIFGSMSGGKTVFDENMHPTINSKAGLETIKLMKKHVGFMPPGFLNVTWSECFEAFIEGHVLISLNYGDIGRLILNEGTFGGSGGLKFKGKIGYGPWPATNHNGELVRYNSMCHGRIIAITESCKNKEAAFQAVLEVIRQERSLMAVSNVDSGSEPYAESHLDVSKWDINVDPEWIDWYVKSVGYGYPQPLVPGLMEYYDILRGSVHGYLSGEGDAKQVLNNVEVGWEDVTERIGRDEQIEAWKEVMDSLREMGFKI